MGKGKREYNGMKRVHHTLMKTLPGVGRDALGRQWW